jgi:hypothetical protein
MPSGLQQLETLDLLDFDPRTGKAVTPPESRVTSVAPALALFGTLLKGDESSSINRARVDAMFDGAPPYDPKVLQSTGQGHRCNLNFGEAQRMLDTAMAGYVDLLNSVDYLAQVSTTSAEPGERLRYNHIIAEEVTRTFRKWPSFHGSFLRLATQFIKHGVGVAFYEDNIDWRWKVTGLSDFIIPRDTLATEEAVEVAFAPASYMVHELYSHIKNEGAATTRGWDVQEAQRVLQTASRDDKTPDQAVQWEEAERRIKNNDVIHGQQAKKVDIVHMWVREMNGTISHFIFAARNPEGFLYKSVGRFKTVDEAFVVFSYGVGNNGTYHAVRGLGQRIFSHVQASNRLRCQLIDGAAMASTIMIRPESARALSDLSYSYWGPYSILSDRAEVIDKGSVDLTKSTVPAINDLSQQLRESAGFYGTGGASAGSPYRTHLQVQAELEDATRLASANLNLFYAAWTRLMRESTRRLVSGKSKDAETRDFHRRLAARGVPMDVLKSIDYTETYAVRAVGAGNASARAMALTDLTSLLPELNEMGKRNLIFDRVASRVGYDMARRYVEEPQDPQYSVEGQLAEMENILMSGGKDLPVEPAMMHETHLERHLPDVNRIIQSIEIGELDPMQELQGLQIKLAHIDAHTQNLAGRQSAGGIFASARQTLNNAGNVVKNMERKIKAMQRREAEAAQAAQEEAAQAGGDPPQAPAESDQLLQLKMAAAQLDMQIKQAKADVDMEIKQAKAAQDRALKDAEVAQRLGNTLS